MAQADARRNFIKANPGVRRAGYNGYWYKCAHCGKWCVRNCKGAPAELKMEVDHIKPWSHGGSDEAWNLQALCMPCNRNKSANPTFGDNVRIVGNTVFHPVDAMAGVARGAFRQNKVLKALGLNKRH